MQLVMFTHQDSLVQKGLNYLKVEVPHYWSDRKRALEILRYLSRLEHIHHLPHWKKTLKLRGFWLARWRMIMVNY
jgi:hypothetical protein